MDVWMDSGLMWRCAEPNGVMTSADLAIEGKDQFRGWFQSLLITSKALKVNINFSNITVMLAKLISSYLSQCKNNVIVIVKYIIYHLERKCGEAYFGT